MDNFTFVSPTKMILEGKVEDVIGREVKSHADHVLLVHYGDDFFYRSGLYDRIINSLKKEQVEVDEIFGIQPNPVLDPIRKGIALCREKGIRFILAVGGGSVIDTAKAIAAGAEYSGDVWDLYTGKGHIEKALAIGTVMTLPGTGSEASNGSVITNEETHEKRDVMSDLIRPAFVVLDPELTYTLPPFQTACGVVDMLSHLMERYFSTSEEVEVTDRLGEGLMKAIINNGKRVREEPENYHVRANLMVCALLAHNGLTGIGRNQDWACHMIGAQLSGHYNAIHGATLSVLLPGWASYVYQEHPERFAQFAERVFDISRDGKQAELVALEGINKLVEFYQTLEMPLTLRQLNINDDSKFRTMAEAATSVFGPIGCMKQLTADDVEKILYSVQ